MKHRLFAFLIIFLVLSSPAFSADISQLQKGIDESSQKVSDFFSDVGHSELLIVTGSQISIEDKILFNMLKSQVDAIQQIKVESDKYSLESGEYRDYHLVLIGGEKTNVLSKELSLEGDTTAVSPMIMVLSETSGKKAMMLYSEKEISNNENYAVSKSPLSNFLDKNMVPAAATLFSLILLYLWSIIGKTIAEFAGEFFSSKITDRLTKGKKINKKEHLRLHEFIDFREIIALILTTLVFAFTLSWTWSENPEEFKRMFLINLAIIGIISAVRESARQYFCYKNKIRTEYSFWPFGSLVTIASTFLGNTFSLVAYTLLDENTDEKKFGKISFLISVFTYISAVIAYLVNIFSPNLVYQMIFVYCIMMLFIESFPMPPFSGSEIKKWSLPAWAISYFIIFVSYLYVNFTAYV